MTHYIRRIISGGQTGADRGSIEAAWDLKLATGGYAPAGWRSEDGEIPEPYRCGMIQSASSAYPVRTRANIEASDGTLILSFGPLRFDSGSMLTVQIARTVGKSVRHLMLESEMSRPLDVGIKRVREWLQERRIRTLNVAGPRESIEPGIQAAVRATLAWRILMPTELDPWDAL